VSLRGRKRANNVNVNVGETTGRNGNGLGRRRDVSVDFGFLAGKAFSRPLVEVRGHVRPDKSGRDESACGSYTRMTEGMEMEENLFAEGMRNQWADCGSGNVNKQGEMRRKRKRSDV
jgi:hypothetical protein